MSKSREQMRDILKSNKRVEAYLNADTGEFTFKTYEGERLVEELKNPKFVVESAKSYMESWEEDKKQHQDANQLSIFETELQQVERQLKSVDREQHQLLQWALKGFPEDQVEAENRRLNRARKTLKARQAELEAQIKVSQDAAISIPKLESFIERMQDQIANLDFEGKRQVLDMLDIKVWIDNHHVEVTGTIDEECVIALPQSALKRWNISHR